MLILIQGKDDSPPLQSDLSALPSFVVHKRALHPRATLLPTGMNNQFSTQSIPDPNTNSSRGCNNPVSTTGIAINASSSLTHVIRVKEMTRGENEETKKGNVAM